MSSFTQPRIKTFKAGEDMSAKQFTFVKFGSDDESVVGASVAGEATIGILMNAPASGELAEVAMAGGGAKLKAAATHTRGDHISTSASGTSKAAATTEYVGAKAHASCVSGDVFEVDVVAFIKP